MGPVSHSSPPVQSFLVWGIAFPYFQFDGGVCETHLLDCFEPRHYTTATLLLMSIDAQRMFIIEINYSTVFVCVSMGLLQLIRSTNYASYSCGRLSTFVAEDQLGTLRGDINNVTPKDRR